VVKYQAPEQRTTSLRRLAALAGSPALPDDLMMTTHQLRSMHRCGMEIGGHTIGHPILTTLTDDAARAEIDGGRRALQALIDAPVDVFAYPNGVPDRDYDTRHVDMVRSLGFLGAVTTARGAAGADADRFQLPRYSPWGANLAQWSARLVASRTRLHYQLAGAQPAA
jgi:peptidoglycan/xylan/chitin deacetylase (PgdA/CDA1 family)